MGPANIDGQDAMSALQSVVDTENGAHYVDRAGVITFKARSARYNATVPMYTFGENSGEYPYEDCTLDFDSTHLSNQVTVTQESTSQNFYATDATSITDYFPRTMSRSINASDTGECQDAASYLLSRYRQPAQRVSSLKLHPSANPALWPVCLNLELGTRVRVMRRPPGVPAIQVDCFVENIQWDVDDTGEAWCTLQCSPADLTPYGIFAAWHTTLATSPGSGVTTVTVNASADNTNPLAGQLAGLPLIAAYKYRRATAGVCHRRADAGTLYRLQSADGHRASTILHTTHQFRHFRNAIQLFQKMLHIFPLVKIWKL
jgi:hypothetical protein